MAIVWRATARASMAGRVRAALWPTAPSAAPATACARQTASARASLGSWAKRAKSTCARPNAPTAASAYAATASVPMATQASVAPSALALSCALDAVSVSRTARVIVCRAGAARAVRRCCPTRRAPSTAVGWARVCMGRAAAPTARAARRARRRRARRDAAATGSAGQTGSVRARRGGTAPTARREDALNLDAADMAIATHAHSGAGATKAGPEPHARRECAPVYPSRAPALIVAHASMARASATRRLLVATAQTVYAPTSARTPGCAPRASASASAGLRGLTARSTQLRSSGAAGGALGCALLSARPLLRVVGRLPLGGSATAHARESASPHAWS